MRNLASVLLLAVALIFPEGGQGPDAIRVRSSGKSPVSVYAVWLPAVMRSSPLPPPTPGVTRTPVNGLTVLGRVSLGETGGPGLEAVAIRLFFSSYYPGDVVATTDGDGRYQSAFIYIPGDEMVTLWPELAGYAFDPPHHYWRHYAGVEHAVRDFVAHAVTPTPTTGPALTASPTATHAPTATHTTTCTATATVTPTASPAQTGTAMPTWTATPTHSPAPSDLHISYLRYAGSDEYVEVTNRGGSPQDMTSWRIQSVRGDQW
jgi:hypothetical protein